MSLTRILVRITEAGVEEALVNQDSQAESDLRGMGFIGKNETTETETTKPKRGKKVKGA